MKRENFIGLGLTGFAGILSSPLVKASSFLNITDNVDLEIIREFVIAGHNDLPKVKEMLNNIPNLMYSRHDWGDGDFEEAIEGAGHVGDKEIANYLIENGARVNIFVLTMLGKTDIVKAVLEQYPNLLYAKGPHGFTLLHHAKVGGNDSKELYNYFKNKGLDEFKFKIT